MATSTYSDGTSALKLGDWILARAKPGNQTRADPDDLDATQKRARKLWERYRFIQSVTSYASQDGQVGVGGNLSAKASGTTTLQPGGTIGYLCIDDDFELLAIGTDLFKQTQIWEHTGAWSTFDVADLA